MICDISDPITRADYSRDPRNVARKAEAYLKSTGIGDTAYFGPEPRVLHLQRHPLRHQPALSLLPSATALRSRYTDTRDGGHGAFRGSGPASASRRPRQVTSGWPAVSTASTSQTYSPAGAGAATSTARISTGAFGLTAAEHHFLAPGRQQPAVRNARLQHVPGRVVEARAAQHQGRRGVTGPGPEPGLAIPAAHQRPAGTRRDLGKQRRPANLPVWKQTGPYSSVPSTIPESVAGISSSWASRPATTWRPPGHRPDGTWRGSDPWQSRCRRTGALPSPTSPRPGR